MQPAAVDPPYAAPRAVARIEDCWFYHTMEVPGHGLVEGPWDLREGVSEYLGRVPLRGRRVLEVGTASGFVCFHMEREGAEVVAYDLSDELAECQNFVPFARPEARPDFVERRRFLRTMNDAWWLCHRAFGSSAKMVYGDVYAVPETIGTFDVAVFGCVLLHLRDPFRALESALRLVRDTVVVTEPAWHHWPALPAFELPAEPPAGWRRRLRRVVHRALGDPLALRERQILDREAELRRFEQDVQALPSMTFLPDARTGEPRDGWWTFAPEILRRFIAVLGFEETTVLHHEQRHRGERTPMFTVVGRRRGEAG